MDGPLLLIAGPGTGKTRVITHKIAHLIRNLKTDPERILAVTFTNKAADEMRDRVAALIGSTINRIHIGTFHAICVNILRESSDQANLDRNFVIFDRNMQDELIAESIRDLGFTRVQYPIWEIRNIINARKSSMSTVGAKSIQTQNGDVITDAQTIDDLNRLVDLYQEKLDSYSALDFDDILIRTVQLLSESEEARTKYRREIDHILVYEFQDINLVQYEFLKLMAKPDGLITVVADEDQSIYSWRGSSPQFIDRFIEEFQPRIIELKTHYRSAPEIIRAAQAVISGNERHRTAQLEPINESGGRIVHYLVDTPAEEAELVVKLIRKLLTESRYSPGDIALFYRRHAIADLLEETLTRNKFNISRVQPEAFTSENVTGKFIALMRYVNWGLDSDLEKIIGFPKMSVDELDLIRLKSLARSKRVNLTHLIELSREELPIGPLTHRELREYMAFVRELGESRSRDKIAQFAIDFFRKIERMRSPFSRENLEVIGGEPTRSLAAADMLFSAALRRQNINITTGAGIDEKCAGEIFRRVFQQYTDCEIGDSDFVIQVDRGVKIGNPADPLTIAADGSLALLAMNICRKLIEYLESPDLSGVVVYDLETIGNNPKTAEIIEIGAIKLDARGNEVDRFSSLVKPKSSIPASSSRIHGITNKDVRDAPTIEELLPQFVDFLGDDILAGHNIVDFDNLVLDRAMSRYMNLRLSNPSYDTYKVAQRLYPRESNELSALAGRIGIEIKTRHRAYEDAALTARVMKALQQESLRRRIIENMAEMLPFVIAGIEDSKDESPVALAYLDAGIRYVSTHRDMMGEYSGLTGSAGWSRRPPSERNEDIEWNTAKSDIMNRIIRFESQSFDKSLSGFLDYSVLLTGVDELQESKDRITLMTLHSAKGTEFPVVIMIGMEERELPLFPNQPEELAEERRLCYVGMTRARDRLYLITTRYRRGTSPAAISRFVRDIPRELVTFWPPQDGASQ